MFAKGRLIEQGTHDELLAIPSGAYRTMWELQTRGYGRTAEDGPRHDEMRPGQDSFSTTSDQCD
jgi:hypothetical protein